jgi:hypothetical protein
VRFLALLALSLLLAGAAASSAGVRRVVLGRSLQGRPIVAYELGDPSSARKVLVVGCIHGNECAGIAILDRLRRLGPLAGIDLWLAQDANPDGHAAEIRGNAHGVDLNRNFPWRWRSLGGVNHAGAGPGSERETRIAMSLILRLRPADHDLVPPAPEHGRPHRREPRPAAAFRSLGRPQGRAAAALSGHGHRLVERDDLRDDRVRGRAPGRAALSTSGDTSCPGRARGGSVVTASLSAV